jgi:hypothetical protein
MVFFINKTQTWHAREEGRSRRRRRRRGGVLEDSELPHASLKPNFFRVFVIQMDHSHTIAVQFGAAIK